MYTQMGLSMIFEAYSHLGAKYRRDNTQITSSTPSRPVYLVFIRRLLLKFFDYGRGERIRTSDPRNPIAVRYQAALHPDIKDM